MLPVKSSCVFRAPVSITHTRACTARRACERGAAVAGERAPPPRCNRARQRLPPAKQWYHTRACMHAHTHCTVAPLSSRHAQAPAGSACCSPSRSRSSSRGGSGGTCRHAPGQQPPPAGSPPCCPSWLPTRSACPPSAGATGPGRCLWAGTTHRWGPATRNGTNQALRSRPLHQGSN